MAKDALEFLSVEEKIHQVVQLFDALLREQLEDRGYQQNGKHIHLSLIELKIPEMAHFYLYIPLGPPPD